MMMMKWCLMSSDVGWHIREVVTNAEAWFNNSLRPWKPEGSSGQPLRLSHSSWTTSYHKSADVDVYVRAGRKSRVVTETVLLCARMLHHFEDTIIYQPPQRNDCIFLRIYFYVIGQALKIRWNVVIYQADEKKKVLKFLLWTSHDTVIHTQKTPPVTCKTLIIFSLLGPVSRKQHTINIIYVCKN